MSPANVNLSGSWQLRLDPDDRGESANWFLESFEETISLPGSLPEYGIGDTPGVASLWIGMIGRIQDEEWQKPKYAPYRTPENFRMPFWLQPPSVYQGAAWYRKQVDIPPDWEAQQIMLELERPHWETRVWLNSTFMGRQNSLSVPHSYDLTDVLSPGKHWITVRVDNRMQINVGKNAHSMSDHTQGNWNGMVGSLRLTALGPVRITHTHFQTDVEKKSVQLQVNASSGSPSLNPEAMHWTVEGPGIETHSGQLPLTWDGTDGQSSGQISLGNTACLWDEFSPNVYTLTLKLGNSCKRLRFGLREFTTDGTQFTINGRNVFLRGTLECCVHPLTGYPPTNPESWRKIFGACRDHGLNHVRFHSWCPPEAAFEVADEMGFYLKVECASWANQGATIGDGTPLDSWLYEEAERIISEYGHHPSFVMMAYGNEPGGEHQREFLSKWVTHWKQNDPQRVHTGAAGWPEIPENQFQNIPDPRVQRWGEGLESRINGHPPETMSDYTSFVTDRSAPVVSHEIGQWCVYPNFAEMEKYTGVMKPRNFEVFQSFLTDAELADQAHDFLMASGKLQSLLYKEEIEASLRTRGFGGFQLLGLNDFPGQGTAPVGVLDVFWESKPYISADEFRQFCGPITPLARLPKRVFTHGEQLSATLEIAHYGAETLKGATIGWDVLDAQNRPLEEPLNGSIQMDIPCGGITHVTDLEVSLDDVQSPAQLKLKVSVSTHPAENDWDIWVFPEATDFPEDDRIVYAWNHDVAARLVAGETLWLMADPETIQTDVSLGFSSIFWNTAWTNGQEPHTLGILCDPNHPALTGFPTESHTNWQWWYLISQAASMELPAGITPIVQVVPDWFDPRRLGLIFEAWVGNGKLLVTSINLQKAGAVGHCLAKTLMVYLDSPDFQPTARLDAKVLHDLFKSS